MSRVIFPPFDHVIENGIQGIGVFGVFLDGRSVVVDIAKFLRSGGTKRPLSCQIQRVETKDSKIHKVRWGDCNEVALKEESTESSHPAHRSERSPLKVERRRGSM